ncbi:hypothetical protein [Fulvivirga lutea]|uniref:Tail specific protease domain-containing protein n=1 Tax=Fulvivirga lutea TaxID=2810512 RepID=A0A974WEI6_9BACT|nr:hypothetical protein [Fulvivirga lutea]QSE95918.1 hypothetical protein JR347_09825 [Fulvivirga lutea]
MHSFKLSILLVFISGITFAQDLNSLSKPQWLEDYDKLAYNIKARHVDPYAYVTKEQFNNIVMNLGYSLDELTLAEKLVELMRIANQPGDGKTSVNVEPYFHYYPIELFWYSDGLRIEKIQSSMKQYAGHQVIAIDGVKILEAAPKIQKLIPSDENLYYRTKWDQKWLRNADLLHIQGITKNPKTAIYTLVDDNGNIENITLNAISYEELQQVEWQRGYSLDPRLAQTKGKDFAYIVFDEFTIYINMPKYPSTDVMKKETESLIPLLENEAYTHLVIDLRQNDNSSGDAMEYLAKRIKKSDFQEHGKIYVITGRETFGQAFTDTFMLMEDFDAYPVGEPAAQNPNNYEIGYTDVLPHSQISYTVAGSAVQMQPGELDDVDHMPNTILMHQLITPNFEIRKEGMDEVMEWITKQP